MTSMEILALSALFVLVACAAGIGALIGIVATSARTSPAAPDHGTELTPVPAR
ncbi:hypothetical protein ABLE92_18095 [Gordonia sp. VNQ95]|jgi:hypothetical protein|uniref:hypothetical protein n=1 Tax=Gordonia sp. VNQ95 TaxID=3156619 RepID=UPI0032B3B765